MRSVNSAVRWFLPEKLDDGLLLLTNVQVIYTNISTLLSPLPGGVCSRASARRSVRGASGWRAGARGPAVAAPASAEGGAGAAARGMRPAVRVPASRPRGPASPVGGRRCGVRAARPRMGAVRLGMGAAGSRRPRSPAFPYFSTPREDDLRRGPNGLRVWGGVMRGGTHVVPQGLHDLGTDQV
jgi:hypothetical protein